MFRLACFSTQSSSSLPITGVYLLTVWSPKASSRPSGSGPIGASVTNAQQLAAQYAAFKKLMVQAFVRQRVQIPSLLLSCANRASFVLGIFFRNPRCLDGRKLPRA